MANPSATIWRPVSRSATSTYRMRSPEAVVVLPARRGHEGHRSPGGEMTAVDPLALVEELELQVPPERPRGVVSAVIGVGHGAPRGGLSPPDGHLQGVHDELGAQVI